MSSTPPEYFGHLQSEPPQRPRRMGVARIICGIMWAVLTIVLGAGFVAELSIHIIGGAIVCLVLAVGCGWYDYRVWTFRARRLWLII